MSTRQKRVEALQADWAMNTRWRGIRRPYTADQVVDLQGSAPTTNDFAIKQAKKLWHLLTTEPYVNTLGAMTGM